MAFQSENREGGDKGGIIDKLVGVRRVAKVIKGGRRFAFSALVVVGDENGRVGWASAKAREVPDAVKKATEAARRGMVRVPLRAGRTFHHDMNGVFGATRVVIKPAVPGTGIIAGGAIRSVFEAMGVKDVVAKSLGSGNPFTMIQATFDAFESLETPRMVAAKRGLQMQDLGIAREVSEETASVSKPKTAGKAPAPKKKFEGKSDGDRKPRAKSHADAKPSVKSETKKDSLKKASKQADESATAPSEAVEGKTE